MGAEQSQPEPTSADRDMIQEAIKEARLLSRRNCRRRNCGALRAWHSARRRSGTPAGARVRACATLSGAAARAVPSLRARRRRSSGLAPAPTEPA
jgi:hypothetical protein